MKFMVCVVLAFALPGLLAAEPGDYSIEPVKDNVYRFTSDRHHSVFMVTDDGIFATDPINPEAAAWLKAELRKRFDQPVRYLAYSHSHVDHSMGGDQLVDDRVTVFAQERAAEDFVWTSLPVLRPDVTFADHLRVNVGDSWVQLTYYGPNNGRGSVSMRFMPANVLFVVDWITVGRMPYMALPGYDIHGMIRSTRAVLAEPEFDKFVGGHADMGDRADVERSLAYLQALYDGVRDRMLAGKTLETIQSELKLAEFSDIKMFAEWRPMNIAGVFETFNDMSYFEMRPDVDDDG